MYFLQGNRHKTLIKRRQKYSLWSKQIIQKKEFWTPLFNIKHNTNVNFLFCYFIWYDLTKNAIQRTFNKNCASFAICRNILKITLQVSPHIRAHFCPSNSAHSLKSLNVWNDREKKEKNALLCDCEPVSRMTNDQRSTRNGRAAHPRRVPFSHM